MKIKENTNSVISLNIYQRYFDFAESGNIRRIKSLIMPMLLQECDEVDISLIKKAETMEEIIKVVKDKKNIYNIVINKIMTMDGETMQAA